MTTQTTFSMDANLPDSFQSLIEQYNGAVEFIKDFKVRFDKMAQKIEFLEEKQPVNPVIISFLFSQRQKRVMDVLGGKEANAYKDAVIRGVAYREAANAFKKRYQIPRYDLLNKKDEEDALNYWKTWNPSDELAIRIEKANNK